MILKAERKMRNQVLLGVGMLFEESLEAAVEAFSKISGGGSGKVEAGGSEV